MKVSAVRTHKITDKDKRIFAILDQYLPNIKEKSVVAVTSKIVSICEGRMVKIEDADKDELILQESQLYLPRDANKYNVSFAINNNMLAAGAGIDESNSFGHYILWPKDPQKSANEIRKYLQKKFKLKYMGVIITDSRTVPMRWGVTGTAMAHSGFLAVKNYIGKPDVFGRKFEFEMLNVADSLSAAAAQVMGEGDEQTPIAIIEDIPNIRFNPKNPSKKELDTLHIKLEDDLYGEFLKNAPWKKGRKK